MVYIIEYPNWFELLAVDNFNTFLSDFSNQDNLKFLQLGAFTGDASKWMLDNILNKTSTLFDVDTWLGSDETDHHPMDFRDVEKTYDNKVSNYNNLIKFKGTTVDFFYSDYAIPGSFDFIYIDADHHATSVLTDAIHSFSLLKSGGVIGFDDYTWGTNRKPIDTPRPAINAFINIYYEQIDIIGENLQLWIRKK